MSLQTIRVLFLDLLILAGLGVGGWFLGAELLSDKAGPSTPIRISSQVEGSTTTDGTLVIPLSGLSPFGHPGGLVGRQVLVGRVTEVGEGFFIAQTASGLARFEFNDDSTFLLRLGRGGRDDVVPGATVAVLGEPGADGSVEARSILVLPAESRPSIQGPSPLSFGPPPGDDEEDDSAGVDGGTDDGAGDTDADDTDPGEATDPDAPSEGAEDMGEPDASDPESDANDSSGA